MSNDKGQRQNFIEHAPIIKRPGISRNVLASAEIKFSDYPEPGSIEIPYWTAEGDLTNFKRWRLPKTRPNGQKYYQQPGSSVYVYYPPGFFPHSHRCQFDLAPNSVFLAEGEFKSLCLLEAGVYAIGLPGFNVYLKDGSTQHRQLLRDLQVIFTRENIQTIYFLGDADTGTNFEFARQAAFLASAASPAQVLLPRIPLDHPKGIDDCRELLRDGDFEAFFTRLIQEAIAVPKKIDVTALALLLFEREVVPLKALRGAERERQFGRIVRLCGSAQSLGKSHATARLCRLACNVLGIKPTELREAIRTQKDKAEASQQPAQSEAAATHLPEIQLPADNQYISEFATQLALVLQGQEVFRRFDKCVAPRQDEQGQISLSEVNSQEFRTLIEQYIRPYRWRKLGDQKLEKTPCSLNNENAKATLLSRELLERLRPIRAFNLVSLPCSNPEGEVQLLPKGYDLMQKTYTTRSAIDYPQDMTLEQARTVLDDLLSEFCFISDDAPRSKSVLLAAGLTLYAKHLLPLHTIRPNFLVSANAEGSGKTLLCKIPIIALLGYAPVGTTPEDEDEMRKLIGSVALSGSPVFFLDNVKGHLSSPSLEALTSSPVINFRLLGQNKVVEAEHGLTVFITGNRATFSPDLRRRTLGIELFLAEVRPETRPIKRPLDDAKLIELRPQILGAFWAFVRHWAERKKPKPKCINQSFVAWNEIIGGIIEACGYRPTKPAPGAGVLGDGDRELIDMEGLVNQMVLGKEHDFAELVSLARHHRLFEWIIGDEGEIEPKMRSRFGLVLRRFTDRLFEVNGAPVHFALTNATSRKKYWLRT